jgi:diguanylate cyclase (GGDEF)-like protein
VLVAGFVEGIFFAHQRNSENEAQIAALSFVSDLRMRTERELNGALHLTSGLGSYLSVRKDSLESEEIQDILRVVYQTSRHVRNLGVAVGYTLTYVHPREGNEQAIGLDYRNLPGQWPDVERAIISRRAVLTDQIDLVQGGQAFVYREPIYVDDEYWGLLSTVIDADALLQSMFAELGGSRFRFSVRSTRTPGLILWGEPDLFEDHNAVQVMSDHGWELAAISQRGQTHWLPVFLLRILGWFLALVAALGVYGALRHRQALAHMALHDALTGLPNRVLLSDRMEQAIKRVRSNRKLKLQSNVAVVFVDIDDFKQINDRYGHKVGDVVLKEVANRLNSCARTSDTVARWAGDEFVLLIEQVDKDGIEPLLQRIDDAIAVPLFCEGEPIALTVSLGYAFAKREGEQTSDLIWEADRRMYERKRSQRS